jgi:hypothetical protein
VVDARGLSAGVARREPAPGAGAGHPRFGTRHEVERRYRDRYLPGQALYRAEADPEAAADVVVDHEHPAAPVIVRWAATA